MAVRPLEARRFMSAQRRSALLIVACGAGVGLVLAVSLRGDLIAAGLVLGCIAVIVLVARALVAQWIPIVAAHPALLRLRQNIFRGWQEIVERVPGRVERLCFTIPGGAGGVIVGAPAHVRVRWSVHDAIECSSVWDVASLSQCMTKDYLDFLTANKISVPADEPVLVEFVADPATPRGRFKVDAMPRDRIGNTARSAARSKTAQMSPPLFEQTAAPEAAPTTAPDPVIAERATASEVVVSVSTEPPPSARRVRGVTFAELLYRPLYLEVRYPGVPHRAPQRIVCEHDTAEIGRSSTCDVVIDASTASAVHGRFVWLGGDGGWNVEDRGSLNGMLVNGSRLQARRPVQDGDIISVGHTAAAPTIIVRGPEDSLGEGGRK